MLYVGLRRGVVQAFDCQMKRFTLECDVTSGLGTLVGVAKHDQVLITCTDGGLLSFWPPEQEKVPPPPPPPPPPLPILLSSNKPLTGYLCIQWVREVGRDTCCMAVSPSSEVIVATGGKENHLKVWDSTQQTHTPIFTAKNVSF